MTRQLLDSPYEGNTMRVGRGGERVERFKGVVIMLPLPPTHSDS
jgi:hypothetical protein